MELSKRNAAEAGVANRATFVQGDMYTADISKATAMILFLIPQNLWKLQPKFLSELKPGSRIVTNTYEIGMGWEPDAVERLPGCLTWCTAYLYYVPAKVEGTWRFPQGELTLEQSFQQLTGSYTMNGVSVPVEGALRGTEIRLSINGVEYTGSVNGERMEGISRGRAGNASWTAMRVQ